MVSHHVEYRTGITSPNSAAVFITLTFRVSRADEAEDDDASDEDKEDEEEEDDEEEEEEGRRESTVIQT